MAARKPPKATEVPPVDRKEILARIWTLQAEALAAALASGEANAAVLQVARQFLNDNGVDSESVGKRAGVDDALDAIAADVARHVAVDDAAGGLPEADWSIIDDR